MREAQKEKKTFFLIVLPNASTFDKVKGTKTLHIAKLSETFFSSFAGVKENYPSLVAKLDVPSWGIRRVMFAN
jgi:hypothetical protein